MSASSVMSAKKENSIELTLLGEKIILKSGGDPTMIREVVALASAKIQEAERRGKSSLPPHQIALLALLDVAEDYVYARKRAREQKEALNEKSIELFSLIEAELKQ